MFSSSLNDTQKITALNSAEQSLAHEIYRLCLFMGIDPDTFDPATWVQPEPIIRHEETLMTKSCIAYVNVKAKLAEFE